MALSFVKGLSALKMGGFKGKLKGKSTILGVLKRHTHIDRCLSCRILFLRLRGLLGRGNPTRSQLRVSFSFLWLV